MDNGTVKDELEVSNGEPHKKKTEKNKDLNALSDSPKFSSTLSITSSPAASPSSPKRSRKDVRTTTGSDSEDGKQPKATAAPTTAANNWKKTYSDVDHALKNDVTTLKAEEESID